MTGQRMRAFDDLVDLVVYMLEKPRAIAVLSPLNCVFSPIGKCFGTQRIDPFLPRTCERYLYICRPSIREFPISVDMHSPPGEARRPAG